MYEKLLDYQKRITETEYIINILGWELRVNSPNDSKNYLIDIKNKFELELFELETSKEYEKLLEGCINDSNFSNLSIEEQRYIKNLYKKYQKNIKVPSNFYKEYKKHLSISCNVWEEAKKSNNYELFKPYLEKTIELTKKYYSYIDSNKYLYDVMLDEYELGMTSDVIDKLFDELKVELIPLIKKFSLKEAKDYNKEYSDSELIECAKILLNYIGFDMNKGALGIYPHGFTEKIGPNDLRIAFAHTNDPIDFVTTIIHEGGHGIFEQNIMPELSKYKNSCLDNLYALHESQSRFYENILGRNINFWYPIYDEIKSKLNLDIDINEFACLLNRVKLGPIRTVADELTYCLHIILRYELERQIFSGDISVDELPILWDKKMKEYLGLEINNDSEGILQDVHWSEGSFGYFPSYLLGTIYDGMFKEAIEKDLGPIDGLLKEGKIKLITEYLIKNIYRYGEAYNSKEVIEKVCGCEISVKPIVKYFKKKYEKI